MANIINGTDTGSGGLITTGDSSDELQLQTAETTAITINSSQQAIFTAGSASAPAITTTGDTNTGIFFPSADTIAFAEGGAEAARFNSSGNLAFPNGQGIDFSASAGGGASSSILDDYEEGTWTPAWTVSGGTITAASFTTRGLYVKIGQAVYIWGFISYGSHTGSPTGALSITGLPFAADVQYGQQNRAGFFVHFTSLWTSNPPTTGNTVSGADTTITLARPGTTEYTTVNYADMNTVSSNHSQVGFFGQYRTTA